MNGGKIKSIGILTVNASLKKYVKKKQAAIPLTDANQNQINKFSVQVLAFDRSVCKTM